jgi:nitronate monooxygenase
MLTTRFTELIGCAVPIQQAGMGAAAPPELAAAVSNAGGLGMIGAAQMGLSPTTLGQRLDRAHALTARPFGVNFIITKPVEPSEYDLFELAAGGARVVELFLYSPPDRRLFDLIHLQGALVSCQVGARDEAIAAVKAGCDLIVAQCIEAGGHVRGTVGMLALLDEVLDGVEVPVLAAGGVGSGRALAAVLAAGADGARVGTRFVAAEESGVHPIYTQALVDADARDSVYTEAFSVGWPDAPHRVLRSCLTAFEGEIVGMKERMDGKLVPWPRFGSGVATRASTGAIEAMPMWAGESVAGVRRVEPAGAIVAEMLADAERLLQRFSATPASLAGR